MAFPPNSSACEPVSQEQTRSSPPALGRGFLLVAGDAPNEAKAPEPQNETRPARAKQNYPLLREIEEH